MIDLTFALNAHCAVKATGSTNRERDYTHGTEEAKRMYTQ